MGWKTALRDELVIRIQPTGLTVYMVYDPQGGTNPRKAPNTIKRDWQDQLITALTNAGINVQKATWDADSYDDRGVLITFFGKKLFHEQKFNDMIKKATAIKWIIAVFNISKNEKHFPENFSLFAYKKIVESDGNMRVAVFKRDKVYT